MFRSIKPSCFPPIVFGAGCAHGVGLPSPSLSPVTLPRSHSHAPTNPCRNPINRGRFPRSHRAVPTTRAHHPAGPSRSVSPSAMMVCTVFPSRTFFFPPLFLFFFRALRVRHSGRRAIPLPITPPAPPPFRAVGVSTVEILTRWLLFSCPTFGIGTFISKLRQPKLQSEKKEVKREDLSCPGGGADCSYRLENLVALLSNFEPVAQTSAPEFLLPSPEFLLPSG